ncbi:MAG: STAS domain-containing protein [Chloroflexota bacterium]
MSDLSMEAKALEPCTLVTARGRVDSTTAQEFEAELSKYKNISLNLSEVTYMSSAGLRALVKAKKQGEVKIVAPSTRVAEVLDLAGLNSLFDVFDTNEDAVGSRW